MRHLLLLVLGCSYELPPRPVTTDAGVETSKVPADHQAEPQYETGVEPIADSGAEGVPTDTTTEVAPGDAGPCTPKTSAGCASDERCNYNVGAIGCPPVCTLAGTAGQWTPCAGPLGPECARGFQCAVATGGYRCQKYCSTNLDCDAGFICVGTSCGALTWKLCWK